MKRVLLLLIGGIILYIILFVVFGMIWGNQLDYRYLSRERTQDEINKSHIVSGISRTAPSILQVYSQKNPDEGKYYLKDVFEEVLGHYILEMNIVVSSANKEKIFSLNPETDNLSKQKWLPIPVYGEQEKILYYITIESFDSDNRHPAFFENTFRLFYPKLTDFIFGSSKGRFPEGPYRQAAIGMFYNVVFVSLLVLIIVAIIVIAVRYYLQKNKLAKENEKLDGEIFSLKNDLENNQDSIKEENKKADQLRGKISELESKLKESHNNEATLKNEIERTKCEYNEILQMRQAEENEAKRITKNIDSLENQKALNKIKQGVILSLSSEATPKSLEDWVDMRWVERKKPDEEKIDNQRKKIEETFSLSLKQNINFVTAYDALLACALLALEKSGYELCDQTGHHEKLFDSLQYTSKCSIKDIKQYQKMRRDRNNVVYRSNGDFNDGEKCLKLAKELYKKVKAMS
jgi:hypothetical protein